MASFDKLDLSALFYDDDTYTYPPFTDRELEETEKAIGRKLPQSYIELLRFRNGGMIDFERFENCWLSVIYGVSSGRGLAEMYDNWINEWEYPDIGIPFGETQSAGHDMYFMDMEHTDENGEPRIVLIDNEFGNEITVVAGNLEEFLTRILNNEEI